MDSLVTEVETAAEDAVSYLKRVAAEAVAALRAVLGRNGVPHQADAQAVVDVTGKLAHALAVQDPTAPAPNGAATAAAAAEAVPPVTEPSAPVAGASTPGGPPTSGREV